MQAAALELAFRFRAHPGRSEIRVNDLQRQYAGSADLEEETWSERPTRTSGTQISHG